MHSTKNDDKQDKKISEFGRSMTWVTLLQNFNNEKQAFCLLLSKKAILNATVDLMMKINIIHECVLSPFENAWFVSGNHVLDVDESVRPSYLLQNFQSLLNEIANVFVEPLMIIDSVAAVYWNIFPLNFSSIIHAALNYINNCIKVLHFTKFIWLKSFFDDAMRLRGTSSCKWAHLKPTITWWRANVGLKLFAR